jgi:hypothetical protein
MRAVSKSTKWDVWFRAFCGSTTQDTDTVPPQLSSSQLQLASPSRISSFEQPKTPSPRMPHDQQFLGSLDMFSPSRSEAPPRFQNIEYHNQSPYFGDQCSPFEPSNQHSDPNNLRMQIFTPSVPSSSLATTPLSVSSPPLFEHMSKLRIAERRILELEATCSSQREVIANLAKTNEQLSARLAQSPSISQLDPDCEQIQDQDMSTIVPDPSCSSSRESSATLLSGISDRTPAAVPADPSSIKEFNEDCGNSGSSDLTPPGSEGTQYLSEDTVVPEKASGDSAYGTISNETSSEGAPPELSPPADQSSEAIESSSKNSTDDFSNDYEWFDKFIHHNADTMSGCN